MPAPGDHVFKATKTIFELIQYIPGTNLLTKFHDDRKINVTSRVLTRKNAPPPLWPYIIGMNLLTEFYEDRTLNIAYRVHIWKNALPLGSHVFLANVTIFKLIQDMNKTNHLTKFHEHWTKNVTSRRKLPALWRPCFFTDLIFELVRDINETNVLTKFHDDWDKIVTSRVFTRNTAPPPGDHDFNGPEPFLNSTNRSIKQTF
ncbi:hypothetical protein DPMN_076236 [Dreissena polymorpha]|uniref:Uncharacterized protein n=1 Tax=Dreissena polymorpha TaxID=45954 RepID=A0A9D4BN81_DREPO|nr:hypothetical protein DPMN_076236 [Dreissena polymorpha]